MVRHNPMEVAKTVLEVADVAWSAMERCQHHRHQHYAVATPSDNEKDEELEAVRAENQRLRQLLEQNLNLLQIVSHSPQLQDCPADLHARLLAAVESAKFLNQLESLYQKSGDGVGCTFPFKEASGAELEKAETLIDVGLEEPSWWVWVTDEMVSGNTEERSAIDNDNYVIVGEEHVVDGVANFMAICIISNPKAQKMTPEELQKTLTKALGGMSKVDRMLHVWHAGMMFYTLSTWGLALAGLYKSRAILRLAARGVHSTTKVALKIL